MAEWVGVGVGGCVVRRVVIGRNGEYLVLVIGLLPSEWASLSRSVPQSKPAIAESKSFRPQGPSKV